MDTEEHLNLEEEDEEFNIELPPDIEAYVKNLYSSASEDEIQHYLSLIKDFDTEKLPPTPEVLKYIELDKVKTEADKEMKSLKMEIVTQYASLNNHQLDCLQISPNKGKRTFNQEGFYEWVCSLPSVKKNPDLLEEMTVRIINLKKFLQFEAEGKLSYDEIPDSIEKRGKPGYTINIVGKRDRKTK